MAEIIPTRFLFRFELPIRRFDPPPEIDGDLAKWNPRYRLPELHQIDGREGFADLYQGWSESGLFLAVRVRGKKRPLNCVPTQFWKGDNIRLMTDMRDARDIRRATRFCQQWYFLPTGGGKDGSRPVAASHRIQRAQGDAPLVPPGHVKVASRISAGGYTLEAHLPADAMSGFQPAEHPRIGIYTMVEDGELGQQYLTVGDDLSWFYDPSTWATGVLE